MNGMQEISGVSYASLPHMWYIYALFFLDYTTSVSALACCIAVYIKSSNMRIVRGKEGFSYVHLFFLVSNFS